MTNLIDTFELARRAPFGPVILLACCAFAVGCSGGAGASHSVHDDSGCPVSSVCPGPDDGGVPDASACVDESPPATTYKLTRVDCQSCRPEELLQQELGDVAVDCGEFGFFRPDSGAIECVDAQLDAGTSFVVYGRPVGIDAEFIEAYVRASDGGFRMVLFGEGGADMKCFGQSSLYRCSGFTTDDGGVTCVGQLSDGQCTESHSRVEYDGGARPLSELRCYNDRYCWADPGHHGVEPDGGQRLSCIEAPFGPGSVTCSSDSPSCPVDTGHYPGGMQEDAG